MNFLIIQLSSTEAVFARFAKRRGTLTFTGGARHPLDGEQDVAELLAQAKQKGRDPERVVLCVPPQGLFLRELDLPLTDRRKIREVLPLELRGETVLDADELVFDGVPLADGKLLAVWAKRKDISEQIALCKEAGLEPEIVTASLFQWHGLVTHAAGACAVTDGDALAFFRDGKPLFFRAVQPDDAADIARTLAAVELGKGAEPEKLLLHGRAARNALASSLPGDIFPAPVPLAGELAGAFPADGEAAVDLAGAYAVARACMIGDEVNFRTGSLAYTAGRDLMRRRLRLTLGLAVACVVLIFAEAGVRYVLAKRDLDSLNRSIAQMYREVFPNRKKPVDEVAEIRSEIKRLGGGAAAASTLNALNRLAEAKGDDIAGIYEAEIEGEQVRVKGDARSIQAVNDFRSRAAGSFTPAEVSEIKSRPDGSVTFVFRGTLKGDRK